MSFSAASRDPFRMTKADGTDDEPKMPQGASYRRASASFRRRSSHHQDGTDPRGSTVYRRTDAREEAPHATKKDMASYLKKLEQQFTITPQRMRMIVDSFIDTLDRGLAKTGQMVPMIPTYVYGWPTGEEKGPYLAIDLGGTNLRVCQVTLEGHGKFEILQSKYKLTEEQKLGDGQALFDFTAECLASFIHDNYGTQELDEKLPLGFTFSYPCVQNGIDHAELIRWTKGFGAAGVEGGDVVAMLRKSIDKFSLPIDIVACINDTTGTLIASHYVDPSTRMGIIFGTGCNAAYMESFDNITKMSRPDSADTCMAINCEWGAFDSTGKDKTEEFGGQSLPRTQYDIRIDEESNKPGEQAFEKMIAGNYLGEIYRQVIVEMIDEGVLFLGQNTYKIEKREAFDTAFLSLIESDPTDELLTVTGLFTHFFGLDTTIAERQFFRRLAQLIGTRAARLSACGVAAIASKMGYVENGCGVATDGSLFSKYPKFPERLSEALVDIFGEKGKGLKAYHAEDGSGVGAAIIAAMTQARNKAAKQ